MLAPDRVCSTHRVHRQLGHDEGFEHVSSSHRKNCDAGRDSGLVPVSAWIPWKWQTANHYNELRFRGALDSDEGVFVSGCDVSLV